jgi:hypothetical protein
MELVCARQPWVEGRWGSEYRRETILCMQSQKGWPPVTWLRCTCVGDKWDRGGGKDIGADKLSTSGSDRKQGDGEVHICPAAGECLAEHRAMRCLPGYRPRSAGIHAFR